MILEKFGFFVGQKSKMHIAATGRQSFNIGPYEQYHFKMIHIWNQWTIWKQLGWNMSCTVLHNVCVLYQSEIKDGHHCNTVHSFQIWPYGNMKKNNSHKYKNRLNRSRTFNVIGLSFIFFVDLNSKLAHTTWYCLIFGIWLESFFSKIKKLL